tara:strand:+ start:3084 stop:4226 length:1143 start_codon:yes stop_codon:yes gene_type:complete
MSEENGQGDVATLEEPLVGLREEATGKGDNLTADNFAQQLLGEIGKEEPTPNEDNSAVDEAAAVENREVERNTEAIESGGAETGDESNGDLLAKYGIDLDSLSESEIDALGQAIGGRAVSRFGELTRKRKEAEERAATLESSIGELRGERDAEKARSEAMAVDFGGPLSDMNSESELQKEEEQLNGLIDWVEESLESEEKYDDEGNTYLAEGNEGEKFSRQELIGIRSKARSNLRKGGEIDKRRKFLELRRQADAKATDKFKWLNNKESKEYKMFVSEMNNPQIGPLLNAVPAGSYYLGLMINGHFGHPAVDNTATGLGAKASDAPIAASAAAPTKTHSSSDEGKVRKSVDAAQKRFDESGSMNDLASLRVAQGRLRSIQ